MLPRCEKHNRVIFKGQTECFLCAQERQTPEEKEEWRRRFQSVVADVLPFGAKLKARMLELRKNYVKVKCPNSAHETEKFVVARILGSRDHLHFACEDETCHYRMME